MNIEFLTEKLYSNVGRENTLAKLSEIVNSENQVYLHFPDHTVRNFPREATNNSFYREINQQLDVYAQSIDMLLDSKELIEWKWKQHAPYINQQLAHLQQQATVYIDNWVDEQFPQVDKPAAITHRYTDQSIPQFVDEPEQTIFRYEHQPATPLSYVTS